MKKILLIIFAGLLFLPATASASTFKTDETVYIDQPVSDDLYVSGGNVNVFSDISGDLMTVGGNVAVSGNVSQDLSAAGGDIVIDSEISDDLRLAGGTIRVSSTVKGDVLAFGGRQVFEEGAFVGGDVLIGGGDIVMKADINGDLRAAGGSIYLDGDIKGSVTLVDFTKITFGPDARIQGNLWYQSDKPLELPEGVVQGEVTFSQKYFKRARENHRTALPGFLTGFSLFALLSKLFFGLFFIWIFRYSTLNAASRSYESTLKSLGLGLLFLVLPPILILLFLLSVVGLPLALILLLAWIIFLYLGKVMACALIGFKIVRVDQKSSFGRIFLSFALGALIFTLIGMVPFAGWVINFLFVLIALGGLAIYKYELFEQLRKKKLN